MGTGGATALVSPEIYPESFRGKFLVRDPRFETRGSESFRRITIHDSRISIHQRFTVHSVKERQFSDIYIRVCDSRFVTPLQRFPDSRFNALTIREFEEHFRASFCFEIIWSLLLTGTGVSDPGYSVTKKKMIKPNGLLVLLS